MGLILDSSVLISAERQGKNARQMLTSIAGKIGETEVGISVVTLIELAHGAARADTPIRRANRQNFIEELLTAMPVHLDGVLGSSHRAARRRKPSARNTNSTFRPADRRNRA